MTAVALLSVAGWAVALCALAACARARRRLALGAALVAEAVHELRGPVCAARLGLHPLEADGGAVARRAAAVDLELRRAGLALEDLAQAPRGRRVAERTQELDLASLLHESAESWRALAGRHGVALEVEAPAGVPVVCADRLRLAQAVGNLVANAVEHGGGPVAVKLVPTGASVRIEVSDAGAGLPAPVSELVRAAREGRGSRGHGLAPAAWVGDGDRGSRGHGLAPAAWVGEGDRGSRGHGLAVAARVAERHGGRLGAAPSARGARLVLELPVAGRRAEPAPRRLWLGWAAARGADGPAGA